MIRKRKQVDPDEDPILSEIRRIRTLHFFRKQNSWPRMIWYNVVRGMAFGFGSLVGATVIVYFVVSILTQMASHVDFVPLLGDWISEIVRIVKANQPST